MDGVGAVVGTVVPDAVHLGGVGEDAAGGISYDGIVFPAALPQPVHDFHELVCFRVALVVCLLVRQSHAACGAVEVARDDVPGDAPVREVVERGHPAGERVRRLESHEARDPEPQMFGHGRHGRDEEHWITDGDLHRVA